MLKTGTFFDTLHIMNSMQYILILLFAFIWTFTLSQNVPEGVYQGFIKNEVNSKPNLLYIQFKKGENYTRIETKNENVYSVKRFNLEINEDEFVLTEMGSKSSSNTRNTPRCKLRMELSFDSEKGYLKGKYKSVDCRNEIGEIVLYPSTSTFTFDTSEPLTKSWFSVFLEDYAAGYPAPHIRQEEMENFVFKPIYFDHDKAEIRKEYELYLKEMVRVVNGHHDIRISVTGHTDAVGTDVYNIGLSKRRAQSIKDYFVALGLAPDKLEVDFKGEKKPVADNLTKEGKQKNRRVDFAFI